MFTVMHEEHVVVDDAAYLRIVNDYMFTVMHEEPLDPTLLEFDDSMSW